MSAMRATLLITPSLSTSGMEGSGVSCTLERCVGFGGNPVVWYVCHHTHDLYTSTLDVDQSVVRVIKIALRY